VALTPGVDFDTPRGNHFVRLSFAGHREGIETGLERLGQWLKS
jgi:aspartate/methionine/tyrosine aminotransferase